MDRHREVQLYIDYDHFTNSLIDTIYVILMYAQLVMINGSYINFAVGILTGNICQNDSDAIRLFLC